ncbi:MAG: phosphoribosylglycinamide formyltransferase [Solirubrobacterales bacterium]|nr:phosphoribosylglycinamide formyltransferase [Solirubrobacterales bacterium]
MRVGVLASGAGTNLQALLDGVHAPGGAVEIVAVASDQPAAPALRRAEAAAVATRVFAPADHADRAARDAALLAWLEEQDVELVVLAGYMALLDAAFVQRWAGRLVNVHPSLLPAFPGLRAIEQAFAYGVDLYGVTVHLVDEGVDTGPILLQEAMRVPEAESAEEVREALRPVEHRLLCTVVTAFAAGRVLQHPQRPRQWRVDP